MQRGNRGIRHGVERPQQHLIRHLRLAFDETLHQTGADTEASRCFLHAAELAHQPRDHFLPDFRCSHSKNIAERCYEFKSGEILSGKTPSFARCPQGLRFAHPAPTGPVYSDRGVGLNLAPVLGVSMFDTAHNRG